MNSHTPRVVVSGVRAPAAVHACRALNAAGFEVVGADSLRYPLGRFSTSVSRFEILDSPVRHWNVFERDVWAILEFQRPVAWIPTCEEIFHLAALARTTPELAQVLWAPSLDALTQAHNKHAFAQTARALDGGDVETHKLTCPEDVQKLRAASRRLVFKPVYSRFAEHVRVRPFADELDRIRPTAQQPWVAQTYLPGEELCAYAIAHRGKVLAQTLYKGLYHAGQGASVFFEPASDARIEAFVTRYVDQTHWHGQIAFDFRRDATGRPVAIECNPRATSGLHLWEPNQALGEVLMGNPAQLTPVTRPPMVAAAMLAAALPVPSRRWWKDWKRGLDVLDVRRDKGLALAQPLALVELAWRSKHHGFSLTAASTADIEWNGEALGR